MNKIKNRDQIIKLFREDSKRNKPYGYVFSFKEISDYLKNEYKNPYQSIAKQLKRLERDFVVSYFRLKSPRMDTKDIIREIYSQKKWPTNASRVYFYTPKSKKTCDRLMRKYGKSNENKKIIKEICNFYRKIEIGSKIQYMYLMKERFISGKVKSNAKKDINNFYEKRDEIINPNLSFHLSFNLSEEQKRHYNEEFKKFLKENIFMDKFMHWVAYKDEKNRGEITLPMLNKMMILFSKIYQLD